MIFSDKLKKEREKHNLSQEELSKILNISRQSISKWETGKSYPDIEKLIFLSDYFKITLDELIKGDKFMEKKIIKDGKKFLWYEDKIAKPIVLIFWSTIVPLLFILKFILHVF